MCLLNPALETRPPKTDFKAARIWRRPGGAVHVLVRHREGWRDIKAPVVGGVVCQTDCKPSQRAGCLKKFQ